MAKKPESDTEPTGAANGAATPPAPAPAAPAPAAPELTPREKEIRRRIKDSGGVLTRSQAEEAVTAQEAHDTRLAEQAKK